MQLNEEVRFIAQFKFATIKGPAFSLEECGLTKEEADAIVDDSMILEQPKLQDLYLKWLLSISGNVIEVVRDEEDQISDSGGGDAESSQT